MDTENSDPPSDAEAADSSSVQHSPGAQADASAQEAQKEEASELDPSPSDSEVGSVAPIEVRGMARRKRRKSKRRLLLVVGLCLVLALAGWAALKLYGPGSVPTLSATTVRIVTPGTAPSPPWPSEGQAAWAIPSLRVRAASPSEAPVPIGSVAKMMTALVILRDHPLSLGEQGPTVTLTEVDVADYDQAATTDQSNVTVSLGETLTELQLLEGLLVHSANNFADTLARWDAGSVSNFVEKMNETARRMDLVQTKYSDASGFSPQTISTAAEQITVAEEALQNPVFASIVKMPTVTLPVAGTVTSYVPLVGTNDVIGVKSGLTTQAGGCDVLALHATSQGQPVVILTAVLGQTTAPNRLAAAGDEALRLAQGLEPGLVQMPVVSTQMPLVTLHAHGGSSGVVGSSSASVTSWPGAVVTTKMRLTTTARGEIAAGSHVAQASIRSGTQVTVVPLVTKREIPEPSLLQRLG